jgi:hypothetical protein
VVVTDAAGLSTSTTSSYLLDRVPPSAKPTVTPAHTGTGQEPTLTWAISTAPQLTTQCRLHINGVPGEWEACSGTVTVQAEEGSSYALEARYRDAALNPGATSGLSAGYTYDTTAPADPGIAVTPGPTGFDPKPIWRFTPEAGSTFTCRVSGGGLPTGTGVCTSPTSHTVDLTNRPDGAYTLTVTVTDAGGLSTTATSTYLLDRVRPVTPTVTRPAGGPTSPSQTVGVTWNIAGGDDAVRTECRLERGGLAVYDWRGLRAVGDRAARRWTARTCCWCGRRTWPATSAWSAAASRS